MTDTARPKGVSPFTWLKHLADRHRLMDGVSVNYDFVANAVHLVCGGVDYVNVRYDEQLKIQPALQYDDHSRTDSTLMYILSELGVPHGEPPKRGYEAPWPLVFQERLMTRYTPGGWGFPASPGTELKWHPDDFWSPQYTPWGARELVYVVSREMESRYYDLASALSSRAMLLTDFVEQDTRRVDKDEVHQRLAELLVMQEAPTQEDVVMLCRWHWKDGSKVAQWIPLYEVLHRRLESVMKRCAKMGGLEAKVVPAAEARQRLLGSDDWIIYEDEV